MQNERRIEYLQTGLSRVRASDSSAFSNSPFRYKIIRFTEICLRGSRRSHGLHNCWMNLQAASAARVRGRSTASSSNRQNERNHSCSMVFPKRAASARGELIAAAAAAAAIVGNSITRARVAEEGANLNSIWPADKSIPRRISHKAARSEGRDWRSTANGEASIIRRLRRNFASDAANSRVVAVRRASLARCSVEQVARVGGCLEKFPPLPRARLTFPRTARARNASDGSIR